jgi:hypothetical protein
VQLRQVSALTQAVQLSGQALQLAPFSQEAPSHLHRESVPRLTTIMLLGVVQAVQVTAFEQTEQRVGQAAHPPGMLSLLAEPTGQVQATLLRLPSKQDRQLELAGPLQVLQEAWHCRQLIGAEG